MFCFTVDFFRTLMMDTDLPTPPPLPAQQSSPEPTTENPVGFVPNVAYCWRHALDFRGRAPRRQYWWFCLFCFLVSMGLGIVDQILAGVIQVRLEPYEELINEAEFKDVVYILYEAIPLMPRMVCAGVMVLCELISLVLLVPLLSVSVRRLHDTGATGFSAFVLFGANALKRLIGCVLVVLLALNPALWEWFAAWIERVATSQSEEFLEEILVPVRIIFYVLLVLVGFSLYLLIRALLPTKPEENRYGPPAM